MAYSNYEKFEDEYLDLLKLPNFKTGLCNRIPLKSIPEDGLIIAHNVDIDAAGKVRTREGYSKEPAISGHFSSGYDHIGVAYAVKDGDFGRINSDFSFTVLFSGVNPTKKMFYTAVNSELYFSNGEINGKIDFDGNYQPWSVQSPDSMPMVSLNMNGQMKKGRYLIAYTYQYANGYESGSSPFKVLDIDIDNFSFDVTGAPYSDATINVYISEQNGSELYFAKSGTTVNINHFDNSGAILKDETSTDFPPCTQIQLYKGSIYGVHEGKYIIYTSPNDYGRLHAGKNNIHVDGTEIGIFIAVNDGFYIGTQRSTFFMRGNNENEFKLDSVLPHTCIPGTQYVDLDEQVYGWLSPNGHIVADNQGNVKNVSKDKMTFPEGYDYGMAFVRKQDGLKQIIFDLKQNGSDSVFQTKRSLKEIK